MQKIAEGKPSRLFLKLGKIIAKARLDMGLSQAELAFKVGMKQPDISKIEEGKKNITLGTLTRLCKVLGVKRVDLEQ
jgi:transcriptional regulator with XRE-family HTH domain